MTVFRADGASLVAGGNRPNTEGLVFTFFDATNLPDPSASHLVRLDLSLEPDGSLRRASGGWEFQATRQHLPARHVLDAPNGTAGVY